MRATGSRVCLGIDPRPGTHPLLTAPAVVDFYRAVLAGAQAHVACVKVQSAFFEALGVGGGAALAAVVAEARGHGLPVIMDAKRGDVGSTAAAYADAYLGRGELRCDALTVSPYLGFDTLEPFLAAARAGGGGVFVLVATSNPGSSDLQDLVTEDGRRVFEHVADWIASRAREPDDGGRYGPIGAVVGATRPERLRELRERLPRSILLVPGYGAQGAGAGEVAAAFDAEGLGAVVNSSRALVPGPEHASAAAVEREAARLARAMNEELAAAVQRRGPERPAPRG